MLRTSLQKELRGIKPHRFGEYAASSFTVDAASDYDYKYQTPSVRGVRRELKHKLSVISLQLPSIKPHRFGEYAASLETKGLISSF